MNPLIQTHEGEKNEKGPTEKVRLRKWSSEVSCKSHLAEVLMSKRWWQKDIQEEREGLKTAQGGKACKASIHGLRGVLQQFYVWDTCI